MRCHLLLLTTTTPCVIFVAEWPVITWYVAFRDVSNVGFHFATNGTCAPSVNWITSQLTCIASNCCEILNTIQGLDSWGPPAVCQNYFVHQAQFSVFWSISCWVCITSALCWLWGPWRAMWKTGRMNSALPPAVQQQGVPRIAYVMEMMQLTMFPSATGSAGWLWHFPWLLHSSAGLGSGFHEPGSCMQQRSSSFPWQWMSSLAWTLKMAATEQILMVSCCDQHTTAAGGHQSSPHPEQGHWAGCWGCTQWDFWYLWGWKTPNRCLGKPAPVFYSTNKGFPYVWISCTSLWVQCFC